MKYIWYLGEDIILSKDHSVEKYRNKKVLTTNKVYKIEFEWDGKMNLNGFWVFYIYDDLNDNESRGYEIKISDVSDLRNYNLNILSHSSS